MKITKHDFDGFWAALGPDWYYEDHDQDPSDDDNMAPGDVLTFNSGVLKWQGDGDPRPVPGIVTAQEASYLVDNRNKCLDLVRALRRYLKSMKTAVITVEIDKSKIEDLKVAVVSVGGKVLK